MLYVYMKQTKQTRIQYIGFIIIFGSLSTFHMFTTEPANIW